MRINFLITLFAKSRHSKETERSLRSIRLFQRNMKRIYILFFNFSRLRITTFANVCVNFKYIFIPFKIFCHQEIWEMKRRLSKIVMYRLTTLSKRGNERKIQHSGMCPRQDSRVHPVKRKFSNCQHTSSRPALRDEIQFSEDDQRRPFAASPHQRFHPSSRDRI